MIHRTEEDAITTAIDAHRANYGNGDARVMAKAIAAALAVFQAAQITAEHAAADADAAESAQAVLGAEVAPAA